MDEDDTGKSSAADRAVTERVVFGNSSHTDFLQQVEGFMANTDLSDADREKILASVTCPCCGGNGAAVTIKLGEDG